MKRIFFMAVCLMAAWSLSAQMTVWSNGQSVYSHPVENVDSISFNAPTSAQVMTQQAPAATSFAGKVYLFALVGRTNETATGTIAPGGFAFYSNTDGYFFDNKSQLASGYHSTQVIPFTYTVSGLDITITVTDQDCVARGKIIGTNAIVIYESSSIPTIGIGAFFNME